MSLFRGHFTRRNFTQTGRHSSMVNFLEILETVGSYLLQQITSL